MSLTADVVFKYLPEAWEARIDGPIIALLALRRPELYEKGAYTFEAHHLYLACVEDLPEKAIIETGSAIVSLGDDARLDAYRSTCRVIVVPTHVGFARMCNVVQAAYNHYDSWSRKLASIARGGKAIQALLACAEKEFENPLFAIDESFRFVGTSPLAESLPFATKIGTHISPKALAAHKQDNSVSMEAREPQLISTQGMTMLACNLFVNDAYRGAVILYYANDSHHLGDTALISHLAHKIEQSIKHLSLQPYQDVSTIRQALRNLVEQRSLDGMKRELLDSVNTGEAFICAQMQPYDRLKQLPLDYARTMLEAAFPRSIAFEHQGNSVVAILYPALESHTTMRQALEEKLLPIAKSLDASIGISNPHDDLLDIYSVYQQAHYALIDGTLLTLSERIRFFEDIAFRTLMLNAIESIRLELLYPEGLKRLMEHDETSTTSYVQTLKTYLENNMSATYTAQALYIHRSTLIERLARIRNILGVDLDDPEQRLFIQVLLKATSVRAELHHA